MEEQYKVVASAGTMRSVASDVVGFPHRWTPGGVTVEADFTGGHLLNLAVAGCVLNDCYREAAELGIELAGVRVEAAGGFDPVNWASTGIEYAVELITNAGPELVARLLDKVDDLAEIPRALRVGVNVRSAG